MTDVAATPVESLDHDWLANHFDHLSPQVGNALYESLEYLRNNHPVARSDAYDGGFYVLTKYEDVLAVAQDWATWSSAEGMTVPHSPTDTPVIPEQIDPPLHREYKRLINYWFRPAVLLQHEDAARAMVTDLIDQFVESGSCDFMAEFARALPGRVFFEMVLHASSEDVAELTRAANIASLPTHPDNLAALGQIMEWITNFLEQRRTQPPQRDIVDAILNAQIDGRAITDQEVMGIIALLLFGGLDTTAGVLGMTMIRFCQQPEIPQRLRAEPDLVPQAVEELLRLDASFITIARTATRDTEIRGCPIKKGERVMLSWASANRDENEFGSADTFDLDRARNRHISFGAGPHRCAGSNLARMNLRIAITELTRRLADLRLDQDPASIPFHSGFNRAPEAVQIAFTPGPRLGG